MDSKITKIIIKKEEKKRKKKRKKKEKKKKKIAFIRYRTRNQSVRLQVVKRGTKVSGCKWSNGRLNHCTTESNTGETINQCL